MVGFLAPDGAFEKCAPWEHTKKAKEIIFRKHGLEFKNGLQAEDYLYEQGYVMFFARGANFKFNTLNGMRTLTKEQRDFLSSHLYEANNDEQRGYMEQILQYDQELREENILLRMEEKYMKKTNQNSSMYSSSPN